MTYINIQFNNVRVNRWLIYIKQNLGNSPEINSHLEYNVLGLFFNDFFFYQGFLSRTLTTHRTAGEGREHLFATLHVIWLSHIFNRIACIYQTATRWDLPPCRITIWLVDDVKLRFCLLTWRFDSSFFVTAVWDGKPMDTNSHRLLPSYYKRTD